MEALGDDLSVTDRTPSGVVLHGERKRRTGSEPGDLLNHEQSASRSRDPHPIPDLALVYGPLGSSRSPVLFRTRHANRGTAAVHIPSSPRRPHAGPHLRSLPALTPHPSTSQTPFMKRASFIYTALDGSAPTPCSTAPSLV